MGVIFYKLITGYLPFQRERSNLIKKIEYKIIENEELNRIFLKTIHEKENFRYKNIEEFKNDLIIYLDKKEV